MKNVLLIGDSIRAGYDKSVRKTLEGKANVYFPTENCRFASYLLRNIHTYKKLVKDGKVDVIHWNTGLWDTLRLFEEEPHSPIEFYVYYIDRLCKRIQKIYPDAQVVFATSTSVLSDKMKKNFMRYNEDIEKYNAAAIEVVKKYGFLINDLYTLSGTLPEEAHSDAVHFYTPLGTEAFTKKVVECLKPLLGIDEELVYQEVLHTEKPVGI